VRIRLNKRLNALFASDGYRRLLRWAALPVTDRRWGATLAAVALGFGLFVGVALGPGTSGSIAGVAQIIEEEEPPLEASAEAEGSGGEGSEEAETDDFEEEEGFGSEESFSEEGFEEAGFEFAEEEAGEPFAEETPTRVPAETEPEDEGSGEEGQTVTAAGTVVHANPAAGSYALVEQGGTLAAIHAKQLPTAGTQVSVPVRALANGTFVEAGPRRKTGTKPSARFSGIVTYVDADPAAPAYSVSKRGVSLLVKVHPDPTGAVPALPVVGAYANVTAAIEAIPAPGSPSAAPPPAPEAPPAPLCDGQPLAPPPVPPPTASLWQAELDADGVPFAYSDFAGILTAVCPAEGRLFLSADDSREAGADIAFTVPKSISAKKLQPGDSVTATAEIGTDGTLTLKGLASDEKTKGAGDAEATQGDLVNHNEE
jgi:hypothetical protein